MPHALLDGAWPRTPASRSSSSPRRGPRGGPRGHARSIGEEERWLFRVTIDEPELVQQLLLVAQRRAAAR
jgi:hypothetical protein